MALSPNEPEWSSQREYEELYNLAPIVKNLRRDADQVNAFFINYPESIDG